MVTNVIALVLTLAVMFELSWEITLLSVVLLPVFVIPARRVGSKVGKLQREAADHNSAMTSQMTERFSAPGATLVKLYGRPDQEAAEFGHRADRVRDIGVRTAVATEVFFRALTLVSGLAQALIYGLGGYLALQGELAPGTVVTLALLLNRLYGPLTALATARLDVVTALVSFDRIFEVLDVEPLIAEPEHPVALPGRAGVGRVRRRALPLPVRRPGVARVARGGRGARRARRRRGAARRVVRGRARATRSRWSVRRARGSRPSRRSCRVSTTPTRVRCTLGGVDVRDLSFETLRRSVGVVTQDGHLFHDSIGANLRYAAPDATDDDIWAALGDARLADLVRSLPDGLDTVIGERGYRLSGGERQRLTLARVLLAQPRVVILDEATAHLDAESEAAVQDALAVALEGRTALVIAHRLSTIRAADEILVVDAGRDRRAGHAPRAARGGRALRRPVPHAVRRRPRSTTPADDDLSESSAA